MLRTLNGTRPLGSEGSTNAPAARLTGANALSKTSTLPLPAPLAASGARWGAIDGHPGIEGPRGRDLNKGGRTRIPGRNGSIQTGEDEMCGTTVAAIIYQERGSVGIADLAGRSLG